MTRGGLAASRNERALSEVVGFVLILGIITAAFSLYLVYGVPAQGRENEILHMNDIKDQFVSYKIGVDSLWTNQQKNIAISTSFPLGTSGQTAQGSNSIIPILQPVASSGTLGINQRTATPESLTISSNTYITTTNAPLSNTTTLTNPVTTLSFSNPPSAILVNLSTSNASWAYSSPGSIRIDGNNWTATIAVTPNVAECLTPSGSGTNISYILGCNGSDITVSVTKNGVTTLNRAIAYANIKGSTLSSVNQYSVNLLDPTYGLQSFVSYPSTMTFSSTNLSSPPLPLSALPSVTTQYAYQQQTNYSYFVPLGSLTYNAKNNYWISQSYYYQMGGVFLSQTDGITYKLPPEITFLNNGNGNISINIVAIAYDPANSGIVGGNSPAQVSTSLESDSGTLPYATISPNTWSTKISILTPDPNAATMWKNYLNASANQTGGIPHEYYRADFLTNGSYIEFNSANWTSDGNPHITLNVKTANLSTSVHGVGGALQ